MPASEENFGDSSDLFRALNDRIRQLRGAWPGEYDFVCECSDDTCTQVMRLSEQEYESVVSVPDHFAVVPGHEDPGSQDVVSSNGRYVVVRKRVQRRRIEVGS